MRDCLESFELLNLDSLASDFHPHINVVLLRSAILCALNLSPVAHASDNLLAELEDLHEFDIVRRVGVVLSDSLLDSVDCLWLVHIRWFDASAKVRHSKVKSRTLKTVLRHCIPIPSVFRPLRFTMSRLSDRQAQRSSTLTQFKKDWSLEKSQTSEQLKSPRHGPGSPGGPAEDSKLARNRSYVKSQNLADRLVSADGKTRAFAQSREEMIDRYLELAMEYRDLLREHKVLEKDRKEIEVSIASIFMQDDRLDELIRIVKERNAEETQTETPPKQRLLRRTSFK